MATFFAQATQYLPLLLKGLWLTIAVTVLALCLSTVLGLVWALLRTSGIPALATPTRIFIELLRGIPILVVLFYIYFVMPEIGLDLTAFQAGVIGSGAHLFLLHGETFRAGIRRWTPGRWKRPNPSA